MKICFVTEIFLPFIGGAEVVIYEVARRLVRKGHDVHVLTAVISNEPLYEEIEGVKIHRIKMPVSAASKTLGRPAFVFWSAPALERLIKKENFDIINENVAPNPSFTPSVAKRHGIPCVGTLHDIPNWSKLGYSFPTAFLNSTQISYFLKTQPYSGFITVSNATKDKLRAITSKGVHKTIYNGADLESIDRIKITGRFDNPTVLFIGRFSLNKRVDWLLDATAELIKRFPDIKVFVVGTGPDKFRKPVMEMWKKLKLEKNVEFLGKISEEKKIELLKKSHILALPSTTEGCPLVVLEAMACGTPVVASAVGGIPEIIHDAGLSVEGRGQEFAEKMGRILSDTKLREKMGKNGRKYAEEIYNWNGVAEEYLKFYMRFVKD